MHNKLADAGTLVAGLGATTSITLSQVNEFVSIVAGCVAIVSGVCAAIYYIKKTREVGKDDQDKGNG